MAEWFSLRLDPRNSLFLQDLVLWAELLPQDRPPD